MQFLYLDDSGSHKNPNETYFVLGGVCVPDYSVRWLQHEIESIAEGIDPTDPDFLEFHAADIFSGKNPPWDQNKDKRARIDIIKKVLCVLGNAKPAVSIFACAVHKASFPNEDPVLKAYEEVATKFNNYLEKDCSTEKTVERGMIIIDKSSYESGLQSLSAKFRKSGNKRGRQLRNIIEVPLFIDSKASRITQLADHIAYSVFRRYNSEDISYFNCIEKRFYQKDGIIYGLVHCQINNPSCTCPACMSRRS